MSIELKKETREAAADSIKKYFDLHLTEEMAEPITTLQADALLRFFLEEIAPCVYNQAVTETQEKLQERVMEIDHYVYAEEFTYWNKRKKK